jgi:hypothetical protein
MTKSDEYRKILRSIPTGDWDAFLLRESGLPGPRGNLELAAAVAEEGDRELFSSYLAHGPERAPANQPEEFLAFCGVLGLGHLIAEGDSALLEVLRPYASDPRWRTREAVAMALQAIGRADMAKLLGIAREWRKGSWLEKRAVIAGLAEPILLADPACVLQVLDIFDAVTADLQSVDMQSVDLQSVDLQAAPFKDTEDRKEEGYRVLRQGLAYAWSVVAAALPAEGLIRMERWLADPDPDVRWLMKENLKKKRLVRVAPEWVAGWQARLE